MNQYMRGFVIHHLNDWNDLPIMERWFHREHAPDVISQRPWLQQYDMYRAINPPPEAAEEFCFMNYRVHETVVATPGRPNMNGQPSMRAEPIDNAMNVAMFCVEAVPDQDLWGAQRRPFETPIIRWLAAFKYPDGVDKIAADDWYFSIHCREVIEKTPQLVRYFSYKAIKRDNATTQHEDGMGDAKNFHLPFTHPSPNSLARVSWDRLTEMWFESGKEWTRFVREIAPMLTPPPWATQSAYPWIVPGKEFCSTFLLERPSEDLMKTSERIYYG